MNILFFRDPRGLKAAKRGAFAGLLILGLVRIGSAEVMDTDPYARMRKLMVDVQLRDRGIKSDRVLGAMEKVKRHLFVPAGFVEAAYEDRALPIGEEQTISQPYVVAFMTEAVLPEPGDRVLEIGTGSGYQAAVLAELANEVYTVEILKSLSEEARRRLERLGYKHVFVKQADGREGWVDHAPYDAIVVTAASPDIPERLVEQLKIGGRLIMPLGSGRQELVRVTKTAGGLKKETLLPVRFVPLVKAK